NPTQDAAVNILPSGAIVSGNVTVQRFMSKEGWSNTRIYRYISSPVQNAPVSDLQLEIPVSGNFSGRSLCTGCSLNQSLFAYDETVIGDADGNHIVNEHDGYIDFPDVSNTETFQPGRGYALFVRGNILSSTSWDLRGPINTGNNSLLSIPVSYTSSGTLANDGWNLVGNPFPSTIDWNASSGWTKTNLDASIYITDNGNAAQQIASWNGVTGTNGGSRFLATGQGFWIKANGLGTPVLRANENIKAPGIQTAYIREGSPENLLRITMVGGPTRDETVIHFRDDATENFDTNADAIKLENGTFNLASLQPDGRKLAINSISPLLCASEIILSVEDAAAGIYRLNFSEFESFPDVIAITLEDAFTSNSLNIRNGGYDFSVTSNPASYGSGRFKVKFGLPQVSSDFLVSGAPICQGSDGTIQIDNSQNGATYVASTSHGALSAPVVGNGGSIMLHISSDSLATGQNDISIQSTWPGCSALVEKSFTLMSVKTNEAISVTAGKICREGVATLLASGALEDGHYNWYESETSEIQLEEHGSSFTTPPLVKSKTYFVAVANSLGCEGIRTSVLADVRRYDDAYIELGQSGESLVSNFATGNQWYLNGQLIQGAVEKSITPQQSGIFGLSVNIAGCTTHADYEYFITGTESPTQQQIKVFPNPVHKEVKIFLPDSYKEINALEIINSIGVVVGFIKMENQNNDRSFTYDMTGLPSGVYILRATKELGLIEVRLVKQ
ncbi:MAG TPA: T9SS type A sorting domain-containing protein, partial [Chryseolinea sp.]|nr:T9SS type A sorting domain-containing protein [Chryseolinea sp.]